MYIGNRTYVINLIEERLKVTVCTWGIATVNKLYTLRIWGPVDHYKRYWCGLKWAQSSDIIELKTNDVAMLQR